ncbi:peptidase [Nitrosopumilus oxyclinae]|uniref:Peptidase n=2 Tax=Nitrosopumilus oxyclinae TaxID=1959104 RepID=A0A7D5M2I9_9ARCH|nr:peptidase [Nitrosopumilus oxyclinae]
MLILGSIIDVWKREIHDYYWIVFGSTGFLLVFISSDITSNLWTMGFALIIAPFVILVWRIGMFGGADAFALIALAVIAPMATFTDSPISPFTTLSNAAVLFTIPFFINIIRNGVSKIKGEDIFDGFEETDFKKIIAILIGYKAKNPKFAFSIEKTENGKKKFDLIMHHAENQEYCITPNTWITPGIPYLLLITGGFIIQLAYGDIILGRLLGL